MTPIPLNFYAHRFIKWDGYGRFGVAFLKALHESGEFDLRVSLEELLNLPGWAHPLANLDHSRLTLNVMPAFEHYLHPLPARQWILSMYESTKLPTGWSNTINDRAERMLVPCEWMRDVFKANGVRVPIHVLYGGTDVEECPVLPEVRRGARPYTFMCLADRGNRKGWDTVYSAFWEAFRADDDVALIVKARSAEILDLFPADGLRDPVSRKMRFWCGEVEQVRDIYAQADCYVYPACADGWGMPPREAAACGLPVLATNYSGTAVGCEQWAIPLNDFFLADSADLPTPQHPGQWARVRVEEVAHWMRWCYDHRDEAREKGLRSAAWIRAHQTWAHSAAALKALITDLDVARWQDYEAERRQQDADMHRSTERLLSLIGTHVPDLEPIGDNHNGNGRI